jgi:hypothetical protein
MDLFGLELLVRAVLESSTVCGQCLGKINAATERRSAVPKTSDGVHGVS